MVERVGDDCVLVGQQRFEQAAIGIEAGGEQDRIVLAEIAGRCLFELAVEIERAADEADRGHAEAVAVEAIAGRGNDVGMVGEAEVIVGAEVDHAAAIAEADAARLRCSDQPFALEQALSVDVCKGRGDMVEKPGLHGISSDMEEIPL